MPALCTHLSVIEKSSFTSVRALLRLLTSYARCLVINASFCGLFVPPPHTSAMSTRGEKMAQFYNDWFWTLICHFCRTRFYRASSRADEPNGCLPLRCLIAERINVSHAKWLVELMSIKVVFLDDLHVWSPREWMFHNKLSIAKGLSLFHVNNRFRIRPNSQSF